MRRKPSPNQLLLFSAPPPEPRAHVCRLCAGPVDTAAAIESDLCTREKCLAKALRFLNRRRDDCIYLGLPTDLLDARIDRFRELSAPYLESAPAAEFCTAGKEAYES